MKKNNKNVENTFEYHRKNKLNVLKNDPDNIKRQYCQQNNIKLIEIPYWDYDNIDNIVKQIITLK